MKRPLLFKTLKMNSECDWEVSSFNNDDSLFGVNTKSITNTGARLQRVLNSAAEMACRYKKTNLFFETGDGTMLLCLIE